MKVIKKEWIEYHEADSLPNHFISRSERDEVIQKRKVFYEGLPEGWKIDGEGESFTARDHPFGHSPILVVDENGDPTGELAFSPVWLSFGCEQIFDSEEHARGELGEHYHPGEMKAKHPLYLPEDMELWAESTIPE